MAHNMNMLQLYKLAKAKEETDKKIKGLREDVKLQEHQIRAAKKLQENSLLLAHGVGSGKTLSAIAAVLEYGKPAAVLVPAPLVTNFKKQISEFAPGKEKLFNVRSLPTAVAHNEDIKEPFVIIDEAHTARNTETARSKYLAEKLTGDKRIALLTGTPSYNEPANIAPLINLVAGDHVMPVEKGFNDAFIEEEVVKPGWIDRLRGVKPGIVKKLKNTDRLAKILKGKVDLYNGQPSNMPTVTEEVVREELSPEQQKTYEYVMGQVPPWLRHKMESNLPPSKSEAKSLNSFLGGLRQASLSPYTYNKKLTPLQAAKQSSKLMRALSEIEKKRKDDPNYKAFIFSNYVDAGLKPMQALLDEKGIPNALFTGDMSAKARKQVVEDYNNGKIRALLGGPSAETGLNLLGTKHELILDPHFNEARIAQAMARGIRYKSHDHLPEKERNVLVQRYLGTLPDQGWLFKTPVTSNDEYLKARSDEKEAINKELLSLFANASK